MPHTRAGAAPADALGYVAAAEHTTNTYDVAACAALYADEGAVLEAITDGALARYEGVEAIAAGWATILGAAKASRMQIRKTLVSHSADTIVTSWIGRMNRGREVRGMESWRFDHEGRIVEHHMHTFVNVNDWRRPAQQLRMLLTAPVTAVAFGLGAVRHGTLRNGRGAPGS